MTTAIAPATVAGHVKKCTGCGRIDSPENFHPDPTARGGRADRCKPCMRLARTHADAVRATVAAVNARKQDAATALRRAADAEARVHRLAPLVAAVLADVPSNARAGELLGITPGAVREWRAAILGAAPWPYVPPAVAARIAGSQATRRPCAACRLERPWTAYAPGGKRGRDTVCRPCRDAARARLTARRSQEQAARVPETATRDWTDRAACRTEDPDLFFPIGTGPEAQVQMGEAKAVCEGCPVRARCLDVAFEERHDAGVWGGLSEDERKAHKRRATRNRNRSATAAA